MFQYCGKQAYIKNINSSLINWNWNLTRLSLFFAKFGNLTYGATHQDPVWNLPHFTGVLTSQAELLSALLCLLYSALPNEKIKKKIEGRGRHEKGEMKGRKREKKRRQWREEEEYIRFFKFRFMKLNFDDLLQNR